MHTFLSNGIFVITNDEIYLVSEYLPQIGGVFLSPMLDKENSQILQMNEHGFIELTNTENMEHTMTKIQNHKSWSNHKTYSTAS